MIQGALEKSASVNFSLMAPQQKTPTTICHIKYQYNHI